MVSGALNPSDSCFQYRQCASLVRRNHLNYITTYTPAPRGEHQHLNKNTKVPSDDKKSRDTSVDVNESEGSLVTLITQLRPNRLNVLERFLDAWKGPAVVVLYATDYEAIKFLQWFRKSKFLQSRNETLYHVVYERQVSLFCYLCLMLALLFILCGKSF